MAVLVEQKCRGYMNSGDCGYVIEKLLPENNRAGIHVYCPDCGTSNFMRPPVDVLTKQTEEAV